MRTWVTARNRRAASVKAVLADHIALAQLFPSNSKSFVKGSFINDVTVF